MIKSIYFFEDIGQFSIILFELNHFGLEFTISNFDFGEESKLNIIYFSTDSFDFLFFIHNLLI